MAYFERAVGYGVPRPWLGLDYGRVLLCHTDRRWTDVFGHHVEVIQRFVGERAVAVEHVGSTAVPGLVAKPIVDIALRLVPEVSIGKVVEALVAAG